MLAVPAALLAALCFAGSTVTQHRAAATAPPDSGSGVRLVLVLARQPLWLLGLVLGLVGAALQAVAVATGALLVVQPLLVTGLLLALPLSALVERRRPHPGEWLWAGAVVAGLALFLAAARPGGGTSTASSPLLQACAVVGAGVVALAAWLSRSGSGRYRASLLGLAGGTALGLAGGLLKEVTGRASAQGPAAAVASWAVPALVGAAVAGVVLNQSSYRVGVLTASQPAITIAEPVAAAVIGALAFSERLAVQPAAVAMQVAGLAAMVVGVVRLARITEGEAAAPHVPAGSHPPEPRPTPGPTPGPARAAGRTPEEEPC